MSNSVFPKNVGNLSEKEAWGFIGKILGEVLPQIDEALKSSFEYTIERHNAWDDLIKCATRIMTSADADRISSEDLERLARQAVQRGLDRVCPGPIIRFPDTAGDWNPEPWVWQDPANIAPLECLLSGHYWRGEVSITVAPGGVGKSILSIVEALAGITGKPLLGEATRGGLKVMILNYEDSALVLRHRVTAAHLHHGIRPEETAGRLYVESIKGDMMRFAKASDTGVEILEPNVARLVDVIKSRGLDIVILDPWVSIHGIDGNLGHLVQPIVTMFKEAAEETSSAIGIVAHSRKTNGRELTEEDMAGAFAAANKARDVRVLNRMDTATARKFGLASWEADDYFHAHAQLGARVAAQGQRQPWQRRPWTAGASKRSRRCRRMVAADRIKHRRRA